MKIVKFTNGKYGIELPNGSFLDFKSQTYSWSNKSQWFNDCQTSLWKCKRVFKKYKGNYLITVEEYITI